MHEVHTYDVVYLLALPRAGPKTVNTFSLNHQPVSFHRHSFQPCFYTQFTHCVASFIHLLPPPLHTVRSPGPSSGTSKTTPAGAVVTPLIPRAPREAALVLPQSIDWTDLVTLCICILPHVCGRLLTWQTTDMISIRSLKPDTALRYVGNVGRSNIHSDTCCWSWSDCKRKCPP